MTLSEKLDLLVSSLPEISENKKYWLIRTQSGTLYDTFINNSLVALEHAEVNYSFLKNLRSQHPDDSIRRLNSIRQHVKGYYEKSLDKGQELNPRSIGLISSQIAKFAFDLKRGDTVVIPTHNSDYVSFGIVKENYLAEISPDENKRLGVEGVLKRKVEWLKTMKRSDLDILLFKVFSAHHAISDVTQYADIIERSLQDFFILKEEAHTIINVQTTKDISAADLFGLGSDLLKILDGFAEKHQLEISSKDLQVTINLNSPGKIDFKSKIKSTAFVFGLILFVCGGGYVAQDGTTLKTEGLSSIIKAISEYLNEQQEREMKQEIFNKYKDSLDVKEPTDMINLLKQVSENKDLPK